MMNGRDLRLLDGAYLYHGYMRDDPGYNRFFSYIGAVYLLHADAGDVEQLHATVLRWEAVGVVSYLLIGFWYSARDGDLRQSQGLPGQSCRDFGFLLGIAAVLMYTNSLDYATVFAAAPGLVGKTLQVIPGLDWSVLSLTCILCSSVLWVNPHRCRCMSGCRIRWKARHRSRR